MKVIVNYPTEYNKNNTLEHNIAFLHASLILNAINQQTYSDEVKAVLLQQIQNSKNIALY